MNSQWENFLRNKGEWHGSFTQFSASGKEISDIPSILSLESFNNDRNARITLRRFYPEERILVQEFRSPLSKDLIFFENGSFCLGSTQIYSYSMPVIEFSLLHNDRRSRQVQKYNWEGNLEKVTLIREKLAGSNTSERPPLTVEAMLGKWEGEAVSYDQQLQIDRYSIATEFDRVGDLLLKSLTTNRGVSSSTITLKGKIESSIVNFPAKTGSLQMLLLPDGAWANYTNPIKIGQPFFFEVGWLFEPNIYQRLRRNYNEKGQWESATLITERRV